MLSIWHLLILVVILLIIFGPSRLEKLGPSLGKAIKGFKDGLDGKQDEEKKDAPPIIVHKDESDPTKKG